MKKIFIIIGSIIIIISFSFVIYNYKVKQEKISKVNENEIKKENTAFNIMKVDIENYDFNNYSIEECEELFKNEINKQNNNEYKDYNSVDVQTKINKLHEFVDIRKYYEDVSQSIKHIKKDATFEEQKELYYKTDEDIILTLCDVNDDWSLLKISDELYDKMKKNNGILGSKDIKTFYIDDKPPYIVQRIKLVYEDNKQKVKLIIAKSEDVIDFNEKFYGSEIISDFIIEDTIYMTDKNGNEIDTRRKFTKENIKRNFEELCRDGAEKEEQGYPNGEDYGYFGEDIAVSDNFRSKYKIFLDLFIHYSPLEYNEITLKDIDIENKTAIFEVDSLLECKKRTYECKYELTDDLYLDDAEVRLLKEDETEAKLNNINGDFVFYKNTDWLKYKKVINYTDSFYNKFSEHNGYFPDIDLIDVDIFKFQEPYYNYVSAFDDELSGVICYYTNMFNEKKYYFEKFVYINNYELDDVICIKLPYDKSLSLEEIKEKFLADKELQKELGID